MAIVTSKKKSVLVTIDDHFWRTRKFARDYGWPLLTDPKICLWLLMTTLLVTIATHQCTSKFEVFVHISWQISSEIRLMQKIKEKTVTSFLLRWQKQENMSKPWVVVNFWTVEWCVESVIFVHSAVFHYFNLSVRHTENWNFSVIGHRKRSQPGRDRSIDVVRSLIERVLIRWPRELKRWPSKLRICESPRKAAFWMTEPDIVCLNKLKSRCGHF